MPETARSKPLEIWFQDEARVGQQGTLTRIWAERGTRPRAPRDTRYIWSYIFGAVCPERAEAAALIMPHADTQAMSAHLAEIAKTVASGAHALLILDGAGWHGSAELEVPDNITLLKLSPVMRQRHPAGERLFVDYAGHTIDVACPKTGEIRTAQIFVAALGASNYTYVEATWTQSLPDWISSHVRAFAFLGGVPAQVVPDNLKAAVIKACFYDPAINRTYGDMAAHYDTAIVPARPRKPKDKAKVEGAVLLAERWILARLRNQTFFSLDELNAAIRPLRDQLNNKVTRHLGASRRALFETLDKPALKSLPHEPYVYAEWKKCRAGLDYHVDIGHHYYSVPHQLMRQELWARVTPRTVEVYHKGQRVAAHQRTSGNRQHSTIRDHMPANHRFRTDWTPERIRTQAARVGPNVETFVEMVMRKRRHPEQGYRTCMGVLRLAKTFGPERLDAACERALHINSYTYQSLHSILKNGLDRQRRKPTTPSRQHAFACACRVIDGPAITHPNIRGAGYFH